MIENRALPNETLIALNRFNGLTDDEKFGISQDIDTASPPQEVWAYGGVRTFNETSFTPFIASSDALDTGVLIDVVYFDADNIQQTTQVTLNGTTPVDCGVTATESFRMFVSADSPSIPIGDIYLTTANDFSSGIPNNQEEVLNQIPVGLGQSVTACDRVPDGTDYIVKRIRILMARGSGAAGSAFVTFDIREPGSLVWRTMIPFNLTNSSPVDTPVTMSSFPPQTDIRIHVHSVSDNNTQISASWSYEICTK